MRAARFSSRSEALVPQEAMYYQFTGAHRLSTPKMLLKIAEYQLTRGHMHRSRAERAYHSALC